MQVTITNDGRLQLTDDGTVYSPLSVEAVELLNNNIPAAQAVLVQVPLSDSLERVAAGLANGTGSATISVQGAQVNVTADGATFAALAQALGVTPGMSTTSFTTGTVMVTKTGA